MTSDPRNLRPSAQCGAHQTLTIEAQGAREAFGLAARGYGVVTLHRPSNVDDKRTLSIIVTNLTTASQALPIVFPVHPRRRDRLTKFGLMRALSDNTGVTVTEPIGYVKFMSLVRDSRLVITDSGGIQEETTYLNIPCLTLRDTTERPITILQGTIRLITADGLAAAVAQALRGDWPHARPIVLWDGRTSRPIHSK